MHPHAGDNRLGQLGDGKNSISSPLPAAVSGGDTWLEVSVGYAHTCGLKTDGTLSCWGGLWGVGGDAHVYSQLIGLGWGEGGGDVHVYSQLIGVGWGSMHRLFGESGRGAQLL